MQLLVQPSYLSGGSPEHSERSVVCALSSSLSLDAGGEDDKQTNKHTYIHTCTYM